MYDQHVILDFEMNPVSKNYKEARQAIHREIVEIGAVKLNASFEIVDKFTCLVKPTYSVKVTTYITQLTGIKTSDVCEAMEFAEAIEKFQKWIGNQKTRVYSWSDCDLHQLEQECEYKNVVKPTNMRRWVDFQPLYPRLMGLNQELLMSLHDAAYWYGLQFDNKAAHRALYDAELTTGLVQAVLLGEYKEVAKGIHRYYKPLDQDNRDVLESSIGDLCGKIFDEFFSSTEFEPEAAR